MSRARSPFLSVNAWTAPDGTGLGAAGAAAAWAADDASTAQEETSSASRMGFMRRDPLGGGSPGGGRSGWGSWERDDAGAAALPAGLQGDEVEPGSDTGAATAASVPAPGQRHRPT